MDSYIYPGLALVIGASAVLWFQSRRSGLHSIPAMGPTGMFSSYIGAYDYLHNAPRMVQEGYNQYKSSMFRVPYLDKWVVVVSSPELINDLRLSRDEDLSAVHGFGAIFAANYTLGSTFVTNDYHVKVIQSPLTKSITARFADVKDEVAAAFQDEIPLSGDEWTSVPGLMTVLRVISRASNRLFVGLPLCRDPDYRNLTIEFTNGVMRSAKQINLFPHFLSRKIVGPQLSNLPRDLARAKKHLVPIIEQRLKQEDENGPDWAERPNDLISWLLEHAVGDERTPHSLTQRILMVNFVAIHTAANSFTQALFHLAHSPEYVAPLRAELEAALRAEGGWCKAAMGRCVKLDSFLRESQRFNGASAVNINRIVVNPAGFTFSNGVHLPKGTFLVAATHATHHDDANYEHAEVFEGFRFAREEQRDIKLQMATPDIKYLSFGLGRHACPGRFFAVHELKIMLAYILENYDVKLEGTERPPSEWFGTMSGANRTANVLFRKRADVVSG
ncbi:cytochrome P450 [Mycena sp. CBHHK59/15]|nr:cytochrome P450 [Mycena sp. CBHHK59/15]